MIHFFYSCRRNVFAWIPGLLLLLYWLMTREWEFYSSSEIFAVFYISRELVAEILRSLSKGKASSSNEQQTISHYSARALCTSVSYLPIFNLNCGTQRKPPLLRLISARFPIGHSAWSSPLVPNLKVKESASFRFPEKTLTLQVVVNQSEQRNRRARGISPFSQKVISFALVKQPEHRNYFHRRVSPSAGITSFLM